MLNAANADKEFSAVPELLWTHHFITNNKLLKEMNIWHVEWTNEQSTNVCHQMSKIILAEMTQWHRVRWILTDS